MSEKQAKKMRQLWRKEIIPELIRQINSMSLLMRLEMAWKIIRKKLTLRYG